MNEKRRFGFLGAWLGAALLLIVPAGAFGEELTPPPNAPPSDPPVAPAAPVPPSAGAPAEEGGISRVVLRDGQVLRGRVISRDAELVTIQLLVGGRMTLAANAIREIVLEEGSRVTAEGELWRRDPNRTRYLYAPSAMMLKQGEGYFSQKELFFSSAAVGLTDNISLLVGSVVPALFMADGSGLNLIAALKAGGSVSENLHLAAGAETILIPAGSRGTALGFVFGAVTLGNPERHFTLSAGYPFANNNNVFGDLGSMIVVASGNYRVHQHLALVTENWIFPTLSIPSEVPMFNSLALRILADRVAVDIGAIRVPTMPVPFPWLDFTYNWG